jgi:superoxide dismutase, Cu-Zn family
MTGVGRAARFWAGLAVALAASGLGPSGCRRAGLVTSPSGAAESAEVFHRAALAVLSPVGGSGVHGTVRFRQDGPTVRIVADFEGLTPGAHAFHVHSYGDCTSPDGGSAGGHFDFVGDVAAVSHGEVKRITGNLGELVAGADGKAHFEGEVPLASLNGALSIAGRSVVVHEKGNDPSKPPLGAAGAREACGVIGLEPPPAPPKTAQADPAHR